MNFKVEPATPTDFPAIFALHAANHLSNISEANKADGFLTLPIAETHLKQLQKRVRSSPRAEKMEN